MKSWSICSALVAVAICGTASGAATVTVAQDGSGDYTSIQQAIRSCSNGDVVLVAPGTYRERLDYEARRITVRSTEGPEVTIVDAESTGSVVSFIVYENRQAVLDGFTLRGGIGTRLDKSRRPDTGLDPAALPERSPDRATAEAQGRAVFQEQTPRPEPVGGGERPDRFGGGIILIGSGPTLRNLIVSGNGAGQGGGLYGLAATPLVTDCAFIGNTAGTGGGCALEFGGAPRFERCTWTGNVSASGGALSATQSAAEILDGRFERNTAGEGGALRIRGGPGAVTAERCVFWMNCAGEGSVARVIEGTLDLRACTLVANGMPQEDPGALWFSGGAEGRIENTIWALDRSIRPLYCENAQVSRGCNDFWPPQATACGSGVDEISLNPFFCGTGTGDFRLRGDSPCLAEHAPQGCGRIGALDAGCPAPVSETGSR